MFTTVVIARTFKQSIVNAIKCCKIYLFETIKLIVKLFFRANKKDSWPQAI